MAQDAPTRRRLRSTGATLAAIALVSLLLVPAPAPAALNAVVYAAPGGFLPNGQYLTPVAVMQKGGTAKLTNLDIALHDVKSPLFSSKKAAFGQSRAITGVSKLAKGSYAFKCSLHPWMKGTLRVI